MMALRPRGMVSAASVALLAVATASASLPASAAKQPAAKPIEIAVIGSITGRIPFPDAARAAVATLEARATKELRTDVHVTLYDDAGDPATSEAIARKIIDSGAVVVAGSSSTSDCDVNAQTYADAGLLSLMGTGTQPSCFDSTAISAVNPSAFDTTELSLRYISTLADPGPICFFGNAHPDVPGNFTPAIDSWSAATGDTLAVEVQTVTPADDMTQYAQTIAEAGCRSVIMETLPASAGQIITAADALGVTDVTYMMASADDRVAAQVGTLPGRTVLAASQFAPLDSKARGTADYVKVAERADLAPSQFGLGGYLAARVVLDAMNHVEQQRQPITSATVTSALREGTFDTYGITADDLVFGQVNRSMQVVQIVGDRFAATDIGWLVLPE